MKTAVAIMLFGAGLLALELWALRREDDDWFTITAVMRALPRWAVGLLMFGFGVLVGHFWW